jgi:hypothetical protein
MRLFTGPAIHAAAGAPAFAAFFDVSPRLDPFPRPD